MHWDGSSMTKALPCRVAWVATFILSCVKDRNERIIGSTRDLLYIFFLFVSFKVSLQPCLSHRARCS
jgi:hypothetical protein